MQRLSQKTDKQLIPALERFSFPGRIEVVQSAEEASRAVAFLRRQTLVGIDTETRPNFKRGGMRPVALLQVSTSDICFLFRLNMTGLTPDIVQLLEDEQVTKVGLSLKDDLHALRRRHEQLQAGAWVDIQDIVRQMGIEDLSLQKIFANVFGQRISKSAQLSNWEADVLTQSQKLYAATDAYACILLYERLTALQQSGDYYIESCTPPSSSSAERPKA